MAESAELAEIRRDWEALGREAPLRASLGEFGRRGPDLRDAEFLAAGRAQIDGDLERLRGLGVAVRYGGALDFGCGAGRLTNALAEHFDEVVGVDAAASMLAEAERLDRGIGRIRYLHNTAPDLALLPDDRFDLVCADRVLQHLTPGQARGYLAELLRVLRPGGVLLLGAPDRAAGPILEALSAAAPHRAVRFVQRRLLGYPAPIRMHPLPSRELADLVRARGARLADSTSAGSGVLWHHMRHVVAKAPHREHAAARL